MKAALLLLVVLCGSIPVYSQALIRQRIYRLAKPCASTTTLAKVEINSTSGSISLIPCFLGTGTSGRVSIGDVNGDPGGAGISLIIDNDNSQVLLTGASTIEGLTILGPTNDIYLDVNSFNDTFDFQSTAFGTVDFDNISNLKLRRSITAGGTTGNQTINYPVGTVNFAAGAGTAGITVTNSTVSTSSIIFAIARTNDATCSVKNVVPASGSFVIRMTANCTAETSVAFWVTN